MPARTQLSRRTFLKISLTAGGGLLVGAYLAGCATEPPPPTPEPPLADPTAPILPSTTTAPPTLAPSPTSAPTAVPTAISLPDGPFEPSLFIKVEPDGAVTLTIHRSEMGQGIRTSLAMVLAEELDANWASIRVEQAPANNNMGSQITSGSGSMRGNYSALRDAGALARQALIAAAARFWGIAPEECGTEPGFVLRTGTDQRLGYGDLAGLASTVDLKSLKPTLKDSASFRLIGTPVPRIDDPAIVTGKAIYGMDVRLPGMLYAVVARCPVHGGVVAGYDAIRARAVPGVMAVVTVPGGVAVVAENTWAAIQGRAALEITWDDGDNSGISTEAIRTRLAEMVQKNIASDTATAETMLDAVYETSYLAHASIEPVNCTAHVTADQCEIWAPTQNPQDVRTYVQRSLTVPTTVHVTLLGGGFGRRLEVDYAIEAAEVSKAAGAPVQVVWTRDDDLQHDFYRQATTHHMRAGWDSTGKIVLWRHIIAGQGINGIAYQAGNEVLDTGTEVSYKVSGQRAESLLADLSIPTGPWRAVISGPNAFANECFFDEVAAALQKDPYTFRMELLAPTNRLRPVLELAATKAGWGEPLPEGHAHGIACHDMYGQTPVAMVAEVSVQEGAMRVHRVVAAVDCGIVVQPDMVVQQVEGGIVYGLSSLLGEITIKQGRVQQASFSDYPVLTIGEMPVVEVHILPSTRPPQGIGEMAVPPIVPAVANAIYAATSKRIRRIPIRAGDL
jgi:isoquinoline 1-oxidoreductase beta subunit